MLSVMATFENLTVHRDGPTTTITLDRPEKRNALSAAMMAEFTEAVLAAGASDALAVVIAANGPVFSAGHNFADMAAPTYAPPATLPQCTAMMDAIQGILQPVVAKVHALATAAGCRSSPPATWPSPRTPPASAIPGGRAGCSATPRWSPWRAPSGANGPWSLALSGDTIDATTAADWGLVNKTVPPTPGGPRSPGPAAATPSLGKRTFYAQVGLPRTYDLAVEVLAAAVTSQDAHRRLPREASGGIHQPSLTPRRPTLPQTGTRLAILGKRSRAER